jgi:hypothetical protein
MKIFEGSGFWKALPIAALLLGVSGSALADNYILVLKDDQTPPVALGPNDYGTFAVTQYPSIAGGELVPMTVYFSSASLPDFQSNNTVRAFAAIDSPTPGKCTDMNKDQQCVAWTDPACENNPPPGDPNYDLNCDKWVDEGGGTPPSRVLSVLTRGRGIPAINNSGPQGSNNWRLNLAESGNDDSRGTWTVVNNQGVAQATGNYFIHNAAAKVPEPPLALLLLTGAASLLLVRASGRCRGS